MMASSPAAKMKQYIFFWQASEVPYGCFCNWSNHGFEYGGNHFANSEQGLMFQKARVFDPEQCKAILAETDPRMVKHLGRSIRNFDEQIWKQQRDKGMYHILMAKFSQNPKLSDLLLKTGDAVLVEASPLDRIWGIGFDAANALSNRKDWGENLLGIALMRVRQDLQNNLQREKVHRGNEKFGQRL